MNSNLKKLFGFATIAACTFGFAMNVNAASTVTVDTDGVCTATNQDTLVECISHKDTKSITLTGGADATNAISYTIYSGKSANLETLTVPEFAGLNVYGNLTVETLSAASSNVLVAEGGVVTADTVTATEVVVDGEKNSKTSLTVNGSLTADVEVKNNATLTVKNTKGAGIVGGLTATSGAKVNVDSKGDAISGAVILGESNKKTVGATLNINAYNGSSNTENSAKALVTTLTAYGTSKVTVADGLLDVTSITLTNDTVLEAKNSKISVTANSKVEENAKIVAKEINGSKLTVDGANASVEFIKGTAPTISEGVVRTITKNDVTGKDEVVVTFNKVEKLTLAAGEIVDVKDVVGDLTITAANGAVVKNTNTSKDIVVFINGEKTTVESEKEVVVGNGTDTPVDPVDPGKDPVDPNKPNTGDDQPNKNPQTFDGILSYVGVALSSVGGLGVSLKKRLFR